jgi:hypothetical protein
LEKPGLGGLHGGQRRGLFAGGLIHAGSFPPNFSDEHKTGIL